MSFVGSIFSGKLVSPIISRTSISILRQIVAMGISLIPLSNPNLYSYYRNKDKPGGKHRMNIWHGHFPYDNTAEDGYPSTAPV